MGCKHYFVVDRVEDLVDEWFSIFSTSSRTREFSACFTTACGNPDTLKSMSTSLNVEDEPMGCPITTGLPVLYDLHLHLKWRSCSHERNVYRFLEHSNGTFVLSQRVSAFYHDLDLGLVKLVQLSVCRATSEPNSFIQSCFKEMFGSCRNDVYTFSYITSPISIRTIFGIQQAGSVS